MFIAYVIQKYEGCDYTIGCGRTLWYLKAITREAAIAELKQRVIGEWGVEDEEFDGIYWDEERKIGELTLFEVINEERLTPAQWYSEAEALGKELIGQAEAEREKSEYERLKAKFGGK